MDLWGGYIQVSSKPKEGSVFSFMLPVKPSKVDSKTIENEKRVSFESLSVLVAEDNLVNQEVSLRFLAKLGIVAEIANNGEEVLDMLETNHYDIILMDCHMPIMDGFEATRAIKKVRGEDSPYIIALTASAMEEDQKKCFAAGMDDFLSKPIRIKTLRQILSKWQAKKDETDQAS